ncbi:MAG: Gfo/Idh/MocA family oxidoreductase [Planctomycetota bacterium]|nr:Gfo/Idh/MocA family oxidoreductase [Planctomycetota bacterium]
MARKKSPGAGPVRVCIVGMGIGRSNGRPLHANPRAKVTALCDVDEKRMREFADELKTPVAFYTDFKKMCADPEIDAVFVGTPNQLHVPIALEAVNQGKHVLVTKPLADALGPAEKLVKAAEKAGVVNMMSLSIRFGGNVQWLGAQSRKKAFGEIYYARARSIRRSGIPSWSPGFVRKGGGAFRDMGVHVLDSVWWLMGMPKPKSVLGVSGAKFGPRGQGYWEYKPVPKAYSSQYASDDYAGGVITFANGAGLQVESFWASHQADELNIELFGTEAGARLSPLTVYRTRNGAPSDEKVELPKGGSGFDRIADHFVSCILDGTPCEAPLRHGLIVQEMMEAMLESAQRGREVKL